MSHDKLTAAYTRGASDNGRTVFAGERHSAPPTEEILWCTNGKNADCASNGLLRLRDLRQRVFSVEVL